MTTEPLDPSGIAAALRGVLASVNAGEMVATPLLRARLEGAVVGLELMAGATVAEVVEQLSKPDLPTT